jgi:PAS domain S-box-containing protein
MPDMGDGEQPAGSLLEGLVAVMPDALVGTDAEFRVTVWNAGAERLYGYTKEEALGRFARELATLVGDVSHGELEEALVRDGRVQSELRARRGDGTIAELEVFIRRVHDPPGYVGVHRDVTDRRVAEMDRRRLAAIVHSASDFIGMAGLEGRPLFLDDAGRRMVGLDSIGDRVEEPIEARLQELPQAPGRARVLLVDEHAAIREAMAMAFADDGRFVVAAQAGSVAEARQALGGIDVAIIDLVLPDGDGSDLIAELRAASPNAQALVLSANVDRSAVARAVERGAVGVLSKVTHLHEVVDAVGRVLAGETLIPLDEVVELLRFAERERERELEERRLNEMLTAREREILQLLADGLDGPTMAARLHISPRTQRNHVANILGKLHVHSQLQAVTFGLRHGIVVLR